MRWQRRAVVPDGITKTGHAAITVHRKSQQHLQALTLLRATRSQRYSIEPDVIGNYATVDVCRKSQQHLQAVFLASDAVAAP